MVSKKNVKIRGVFGLLLWCIFLNVPLFFSVSILQISRRHPCPRLNHRNWNSQAELYPMPRPVQAFFGIIGKILFSSCQRKYQYGYDDDNDEDFART